MGKKVDLNKPRETNTSVQRTNHLQRPNNATINNQNSNSNNGNSNSQSNNSGMVNDTKKGVAKAVLQANGLPPELVEYAAENPEEMKKIQGYMTGLKMPPIMKILTVIGIILPVFFLLLIFSVLFPDESIGSSAGALGFGGYYTSKCDEMTVIFVDPSNGYEVTGSATYSMEDYVAGVVAAEVGGFGNKEVYKVYALAARTFGLTASSEDCTIEGSARRQAFKDISDQSGGNYDLIYEAVRETEGEVLLSNGELYRLQYDAFCYIQKDSQYYTLSQKNQKIPVDWAQSNVWSTYYLNCPCDANDESKTECWKNGVWQDGGHGRGMSQYGAYYLATQEGYTYDEILNYYYGDDEVTISSSSFMASIAGLEIKDTRNASDLKEPITEFLSSKGSSLDDMNQFIHDSVVENGAGTREGVVTAAVSMINYLYDNFNTKLPYYWGGKVYSGAIPSNFGTYSPSAVSRGGNVNYYKSFDCSGFVSWSIRNGGYNFKEQSTTGFDSTYSKNSCNITESSCIGQPGDLINSRAGHVEMIIAVDQENNKYFVAHSGGAGVVMQERDMHKGNSSNPTKIIFMEQFYSDPLNVNPSY